ncbi:acyltransferase [Drancourtella massiliensis]|uniref:Acyltransferase n=1 Tax=Drancourtella massiliensis TaxID=1632013 RepID=A0ABS2EKG1_9FIRM|nr:acyltransferase [Drancourtella massiliensis]MBM6745580.1 acyltransferase [Drancourtella massiliensis]
MVDKTISKEDTAVLKGIAIIMMVSGHVMTLEWMEKYVQIWDITINNIPLATIISDIFNYCVSIYAFVSGYAWGREYPVPKCKRQQYYKKCMRRIVKLYIVYWIILVLINFPIYELESYIDIGKWELPGVSEIVKTLMAVSSEISKFNWYVLFFAIAVITYPFLKSILDKVSGFPYLKICMVIIAFLTMRFIFRILYSYNIINIEILNITSRYFTNMPTILIGTLVYQYNLYGKIRGRLNSKKGLFISLIILLGASSGKFFMHFVLKNASNIDSFLILFVMFALMTIIYEIYRNKNMTSVVTLKILGYLGKYSLYIWLIHSIFVSKIIQPFTYLLRFPILIVCEVLIISLALAWVIHKVTNRK